MMQLCGKGDSEFECAHSFKCFGCIGNFRMLEDIPTCCFMSLQSIEGCMNMKEMHGGMHEGQRKCMNMGGMQGMNKLSHDVRQYLPFHFRESVKREVEDSEVWANLEPLDDLDSTIVKKQGHGFG